MDDLISKLSEIRSDYNCFNEDEEPQYRALSEAIRILSQRADGDTISRQAAIDCVTCDVEHTIGCLKALPPAAPTTTQTTETTAPTTETTAPTTETTAPTTETTAPTTDDWVSCSKRLPAVPRCRCLITRDDGRGEATVEEALFSFGKWYNNEWLEDGRNRKFDISASVIAWAPFPAPYRGGEKE